MVCVRWPLSEACHLIVFFSPLSINTQKMAETSPISTGARASLAIFSGVIDLFKGHKKAMAGHCVWMDDFVPVKSPHKRLTESLL